MDHRKEKTTRITYSTVMADLFHYGHLRILQIAKDSGDIHICGLLSDEVCQEWWGWNICNHYPDFSTP